MGTAYNNQWVLKRIAKDGNFGQGTLVEQATRKIKASRLDRHGAATIPARATLTCFERVTSARASAGGF